QTTGVMPAKVPPYSAGKNGSARRPAVRVANNWPHRRVVASAEATLGRTPEALKAHVVRQPTKAPANAATRMGGLLDLGVRMASRHPASSWPMPGRRFCRSGQRPSNRIGDIPDNRIADRIEPLGAAHRTPCEDLPRAVA